MSDKAPPKDYRENPLIESPEESTDSSHSSPKEAVDQPPEETINPSPEQAVDQWPEQAAGPSSSAMEMLNSAPSYNANTADADNAAAVNAAVFDDVDEFDAAGVDADDERASQSSSSSLPSASSGVSDLPPRITQLPGVDYTDAARRDMKKNMKRIREWKPAGPPTMSDVEESRLSQKRLRCILAGFRYDCAEGARKEKYRQLHEGMYASRMSVLPEEGSSSSESERRQSPQPGPSSRPDETSDPGASEPLSKKAKRSSTSDSSVIDPSQPSTSAASQPGPSTSSQSDPSTSGQPGTSSSSQSGTSPPATNHDFQLRPRSRTFFSRADFELKRKMCRHSLSTWTAREPSEEPEEEPKKDPKKDRRSAP